MAEGRKLRSIFPKFDQKFGHESLTFDDVLLLPAKSEVLPSEVSLATYLTKDIKLNIPLMSSPMDTVTTANMAIAMAREGGIGFIHKSFTAETQAAEVRRVKRSEHAIIDDPIVCGPEDTIETARKLSRQYLFSGFPVVDSEHRLIGILTNRDLRFEINGNTKVKDVMTSKNLITGPANTGLVEARQILCKHKVEKLPLVDKKNVLKGLITISDIEKVEKYPQSSKDSQGRLLAGAAVGVNNQIVERVTALVEAGVDAVIIDSAHGHSKGVLEAVKLVKQHFPKLAVIGGNAATFEAAADLAKAGADAIRVGIGPGSICTTRVVAGIGVPQLTAIYDTARAGAIAGIPVIADGGIRYSGDITKALAAGAQSVMLGSLLAGTDESPGETEIYQGRRFKVYRGMGSIGAMREGSPERYFQKSGQKLIPEGVEGRVPYSGTISEIVFQLVGGLRAGMGYTGSANIEELRHKTRFTRISNSGIKESHPHEVQVTREAPNYTP